MHVRVQSLTDSINDLVARGLMSRRPDTADRRRQLVELTPHGADLLDRDRAERDFWLKGAMRDNLTDLESDLVMLVAPLLRKLADAPGSDFISAIEWDRDVKRRSASSGAHNPHSPAKGLDPVSEPEQP